MDRRKLITHAVMAGCPALISITLAYFPDLQERAAIKEFDGNMARLDAELSTLLDEITPHNSSQKERTMKKHSKRTIAGAQATKSQRRLRKLREGTGEASKAQTPTDTPETPEGTTEAPRSGFTARDMEKRKAFLDGKSHSEVLNLAATMYDMAASMRAQGREDLALGISQELEVVHEYVRAFILSKLHPRGAGAPGSMSYPMRITPQDLH